MNPSARIPVHPLRPTVFFPRLLTYLAVLGIATHDLHPSPVAFLALGWWFSAPLLYRVPIPESWHPAARVAENLLTPGLALWAGVPLLGVAALSFMLLAGHLNVNGPRAAMEALISGVLVTLAAVLLGPFPLVGSVFGQIGAVTIVVVFALLSAALSHLQGVRLRNAQLELATQATQHRQLAERLSRYLPPPVHRAAFDQQAGAASGSRRRWLTVCFADLVGFTELTDSAESEEVVAMLDDFYTAMAELALEHGGTLDKFIGDAVMVFFGEPASQGRHEDARACVAMAAEMQQRFTELRSRWRASGIVRDLDLRVGIHSGWCTVGSFGHGQRVAYTVIGATVNAASRIEAAALPGDVLLSRTTWLLLGECAQHCRRAAPLNAKGIGRPLETFRYLGPDTTARPLELEVDGMRVSYAPDALDAEAALALLHRVERALSDRSAPPSTPAVT